MAQIIRFSYKKVYCCHNEHSSTENSNMLSSSVPDEQKKTTIILSKESPALFYYRLHYYESKHPKTINKEIQSTLSYIYTHKVRRNPYDKYIISFALLFDIMRKRKRIKKIRKYLPLSQSLLLI